MIAIVTDSTISIPQSEAEVLDIRIVPNSYSVGARVYRESYVDDNGDFERRIFAMPENCKTSQAPVSAFTPVFEELIKSGFEVLCVVLSSRLSGTYSSACIAAQEVDPKKIAVVDSLTTAGGLYFLVKRAIHLVAQGLTLTQTAQKLIELRKHTGIVFSVDDMSALRRSGRLGHVPQSICTVLNLRPILLCVHGTVVARGLARGVAERIREIVAKVPDNAKEVLLHYMGEPNNAAPLLKALRNRFPALEISLYKLGPVLSVHLGAGTLGVAWING